MNNIKNLIGKKVKVTARKNQSNFLPKINFNSYTFDAVLQEVDEAYVKLKKPSGAIHLLPIKDNYFTIENIEE